MKSEYQNSFIRVLCSVLLFVAIFGNSVYAQPVGVWGLDRIDQRSLPLNSTYNHSSDGGAGVTVYVFDTGIFADHREFNGRVATGYDAFRRSEPDGDCWEGNPNGHGTPVAAIIGGEDYGVAKAVTLVPVRVSACSNDDFAEIRRQVGGLLPPETAAVIAFERGVQWVLEDHNTPAVVNISIEFEPGVLSDNAYRRYEAAMKRLHDAGIVTVVAAGNYSASACTSPLATAMDSITVAASTNKDQQASFSNFGSCVDIYAPGKSIVSASKLSVSKHAAFSATSFAAPFVAGVAALYLQDHPNASVYHVAEAIRRSATTGKISNPSTGTPNRLLYSNLVADDPNNRTPVARNDNFGDIDAGDNIFLFPLRNDSDPDGNPLTIISVTQPSSGRVSITSNGRELYLVPNSGTGNRSFTYVISDNNGGIAQATVSYRVVN